MLEAISVLSPSILITPPASPFHSHCLILQAHPCPDQLHLFKGLKCYLNKLMLHYNTTDFCILIIFTFKNSY